MRNKIVAFVGILVLVSFILLPFEDSRQVVAKASQYTRAVDAYQKFLKTTSIKGNRLYGHSEAKFQIVDVNKDNIPELILNVETFYGLARVQFIYTYYSGKVKYLTYAGQGTFGWYAKGDLLINRFEARGDRSYSFYIITKGKEKEVASFYTDDGRSEKPSYRYNVANKKVSRKVFNAFIKKHTGTTMENTIKENELSCTKKNIDRISKNRVVSLSKTKLTLKKGASTRLTFNSYLPQFTWKSSNTKVATVSKYGKVTAKKKGSCTIKVSDGKNTKTCKVTVKP